MTNRKHLPGSSTASTVAPPPFRKTPLATALSHHRNTLLATALLLPTPALGVEEGALVIEEVIVTATKRTSKPYCENREMPATPIPDLALGLDSSTIVLSLAGCAGGAPSAETRQRTIHSEARRQSATDDKKERLHGQFNQRPPEEIEVDPPDGHQTAWKQ